MIDWQIHPRDTDLGRRFDPLSGWSTLTLVERHNQPDTWTVTGPAEVLSIFAPGMGCILDRDGVQIASGQVTSITRAGTSEGGRVVETMTVGFASDLAALGGRLMLPNPNHVLTGAISTMTPAYDTRTGPIETLILGYINSNIGSLALADRRLARLRLPVSLGRGGTTQVTARLDTLGVLMQSLAEVGGLRVNISHTEDGGGAWLDLDIEAVTDLSEAVRFGTAGTLATGIITDWTYEVGAPQTTRAVVAGAGDLTAREFLQRTDPAAEALWGQVTETLIDQRQTDPASTDKLAEYTRAADEALQSATGPTRVEFTPTLGPDLVYRRDVRVGDIVGYDLPGLEPAAEKIREATTVVSAEPGSPSERVSVVVGTPDAPATRSQQQTTRALRAVTAIQRSK